MYYKGPSGFLNRKNVWRHYTVRFKRSDIPGKEPPELKALEWAVNLDDRVFFIADQDGKVGKYKLQEVP